MRGIATLFALALASACATASNGSDIETEDKADHEPAKAAPQTRTAAPAGAETDTDDAPVLVELFTSQGCSSCPPADALLIDMGARDDIIALAYHVDYWNYIGWSDPFSSAQWSERQRRYAQARGWNVYTPQLVVDGHAHVVGSRSSHVRDAVAAARRRGGPRAEVAVTAERIDDGLSVHVTTAGAGGDVMVAVYQRAALTPVSRGENTGRTLEEGHIVRSLRNLGAAGAAVDVELGVAGRWGDELGVVAFVQDPESLAILGAAAAIPR